jgi:hypothetical protein
MHALRPGAEILIDPPMAARGERFMRAMAATAPPGTRASIAC